MNDKTEQSLAASPEPSARQFQDRDGGWHDFIDERHFRNTVKDGSWPIRNLYTQEAIDILRAQLAEAQKDSDRLNWIEQNANMGVVINRLKLITDLSRLVYEVAVDDVYATEDTLRAAIDAAKGGGGNG